MHVCMYVCMLVYMYACVHTCMYACMHVLTNRLRKCTPMSKRFRSDFYWFVFRILTTWGSKDLAKTTKCYSSLHFSHFPLELHSWLDFEASWNLFWSGFGTLSLFVSLPRSNNKSKKKMHRFSPNWDQSLRRPLWVLICPVISFRGGPKTSSPQNRSAHPVALHEICHVHQPI